MPRDNPFCELGWDLHVTTKSIFDTTYVQNNIGWLICRMGYLANPRSSCSLKSTYFASSCISIGKEGFLHFDKHQSPLQRVL